MYTLGIFKLKNIASFISDLIFYCGSLLKFLPCASHSAGREMVWNIGLVNENKAQRAIIPFVGIIIRKEYEL
jgi:hypothetical protein